MDRILADTVIRHIEALYLHPDLFKDPDRQGAYRRFACHWRCLAAQSRAGARRDTAIMAPETTATVTTPAAHHRLGQAYDF